MHKFLLTMLFYTFANLALAQERDDLLKTLNALTGQLKSEVTADNKLEAALIKFDAALDDLLKRSKVDLEKVINGTTDLIEANIQNRDIVDEVAKLRGAVFAYVSRDPNSFIPMLADQLTASVGANKILNDETRQKVFDLSDTIAALEGANSTKAISLRAQALDAKIKAHPSISDGDARPTELAELLATLRGIESKRFQFSVSNRTETLFEMLKEGRKEIPLLSRDNIVKIRALSSKLNEILVDSQTSKSGVHIIDARFGRVSGAKSKGDTCNARTTVVSACQGVAKCQIAEGMFGKLCGGFDPAPFIDARHKGLFVSYVCLKDQPTDVWNDLLQADQTKFAGPKKNVILRSEHDAFQCAIE